LKQLPPFALRARLAGCALGKPARLYTRPAVQALAAKQGAPGTV